MEVVVRFHEVVDREIVISFVEPRPAPADLHELDHRIDRPQQDDVADVARIHAGRKFLRRREDRRNRLLVVLKRPQVLFAQFAIAGGDPLTAVRIFAGLDLMMVSRTASA